MAAAATYVPMNGSIDAVSSRSIVNGSVVPISGSADEEGKDFDKDDCVVIHESRTTRICRSTNYGLNRSAVAVKTLVGMPRPLPEDISCLSNEYSILTQYLTNCPGVRKALEMGDDENTIYLEWVDGVSLEQWIQNAPTTDSESLPDAHLSQKQRDLLMQKVRIAWGVAKSLAKIHDACVMHNNIAPDNILVCGSLGERGEDDMDFGGSHQDRCPVKIIDLGYADPCSLCETDDCGERVNDDIYSLGMVLQELFVDHADAAAADRTVDHTMQLKRSSQMCVGGSFLAAGTANSTGLTMGATGGEDHPWTAEGVENVTVLPRNMPRSISTLLTNIIDTGSSKSLDPYRSVREVEEDLRQMMDDPEIFLFDPPMREGAGRLNFSARKLHGRDREMSSLMDAYDRVVGPSKVDDEEGNGGGGSPECVLVSGYSGTGKSSLVRCVRQPLLEKGGYFISGKFDQLQRIEPYSAVIAAFHELCDLILSQGDEVVGRRKETILNAVGTQGKVLTDVIPKLEKIIGKQPTVASVKGKETQNRLNFVFRLFVRAISTPAHPVVLCIDDLQWADEASLELIKSLVTDAENASILFIGCYRDNEVNETHPLAQILRETEKKGVTPTKIVVGNLGKDAVNDLISESLHLPKRLTRPLTDIVFRKTEGNVFFAIQLLKSLRDEGLLYYSAEFWRWRWEEERVAATTISDNVVEHLAKNMMRLPTEERDVLKVAAGIGSSFDDVTLRCIMEAPTGAQTSSVFREWTLARTDDLNSILATLVLEGFIDRSQVGGQYKFAHDRIQQASYSLIPTDERGLLHLKIGRLISKRMDDDDRMLFVAVDQLNRGSEHITRYVEREQLAKQNLYAGEKAVRSSAFTPAVAYFKAGIKLLDDEWERKDDLSLRLYSAYAETEYCNGNFDQMEILTEEVFKHADSLLEKLPAYNSLIKSLSAQLNLAKAIEIGFDVLLQLGERFPVIVGKCAVAMDLTKTKFMLRRRTTADISALPAIKDPTKAAAMKLLTTLYSACYFTKPEMVPLISNRMVRISLRYGASNESAFGFISYGTMLCSMGEFKEGYKFGKLALSLLERLDAKEWSAHVNLNVAFLVNHWREHMRLQLDRILYAYRMGMEVGDNEFAMLSLFSHAAVFFFLGRPLGPLETSLRVYVRKMMDYSQDIAAGITLVLLQATLNLMGCSEDPVVLTGKVMDQNRALEESLAEGNTLRLLCIYIYRLILAYTFGEYELAAVMAKQSQNVAQVAPGMFFLCIQGFYDGLTSLEMARQARKKRWNRADSRRIMKNMKKWARSSPGNYSHKLLILEAEKTSLKGNFDETKGAYDSAITTAKRNGFIQDEALAYERAGLFFNDADDKETASHYMTRAHQLYLDWGAQAKADCLQENFPSLITSSAR